MLIKSAEILKPVITGKNISPKSKRNIKFVQKWDF